MASPVTESVELLDIAQRDAGLFVHQISQADLQRAVMFGFERAKGQPFRVADDENARRFPGDRDNTGVESDDNGVCGGCFCLAFCQGVRGSEKSTPSITILPGPMASIASSMRPSRSSSLSARATMRVLG